MNDAFFQAMANETRREIIRLLKQKDMTAGEISSHFSISKPSISRHLDTLKNAGLIVPERKGNQILYAINITVLQEMAVEFLSLVQKKEESCHEKNQYCN